MKRLLFTAILALSFTTIYAQDIIVKKDGSTIMSKVLEVQTDIIKYKKWSNQSGPTYSIKITDIFSINYQNGEKDVFNSPASTPAQTTEKTAETPQEAKPTATPAEEWSEESKARNAELIASYNKDYTINEKYIGDRKKDSKFGVRIYGVSEDSKMSFNGFEAHLTSLLYSVGYGLKTSPWNITLTNNTDKTIYVDLDKCFLINAEGTSTKCYKGGIETTTTSGKNGGGSINLGSISSVLGIGGAVGTLSSGINVGSGKSSYSSTTKKEERFIIIPPHSKTSFPYVIPHIKYIPTLDTHVPKNGEVIDLNLPNMYRVIIGYSDSESFENIYTLNINITLRKYIGISQNLVYVGTRDYTKNLNKIRKEYIPDADDNILIECPDNVKNTFFNY
ncbi:MAG: hypothetical protein IIY15_06165 [Flavobacteriales bacterium]|nr:hypothetical protein [Flavobacteriales bacterium]